MSTAAKFWIFVVVVLGIYLFLVWKSTADPRFILFTFIVLVLFAMGTRRFRCPHCRNPIMRRPTTKNPLGYEWRVPTSGKCASCGELL